MAIGPKEVKVFFSNAESILSKIDDHLADEEYVRKNTEYIPKIEAKADATRPATEAQYMTSVTIRECLSDEVLFDVKTKLLDAGWASVDVGRGRTPSSVYFDLHQPAV
jgi:hypothetical protein